MLEGPGADSEEKREPASDINTCAVDSLKVLDPERPIREADIARESSPLAKLAHAEAPRQQRFHAYHVHNVTPCTTSTGRAASRDESALGS